MTYHSNKEMVHYWAYADATEEFKSRMEDGGFDPSEALDAAYYVHSKKTGRSIAISMNAMNKTWMLSAEKGRRLTKGEVREIKRRLVGKFYIIAPDLTLIGGRKKNAFHMIVFVDD